MSWWLLLLFIFLVWCLWAAAATAQVAAYNSSNALYRRVTSAASPWCRSFPFFLSSSGAPQKLVDLIAYPWGTILVASFHAIFAVVLVFSIAQ